MTTSTITHKVRSRRTPFAANPNRFCNVCLVERSVMEQNNPALKGRCTDHAESDAAPLIEFPDPVFEAEAAALRSLDPRLKLISLGDPDAANDTPEQDAARRTDLLTKMGYHKPAAEVVEETAARLTSLGLDPETGDIRRCRTCDANVSHVPGAEYCSRPCQADAAAEEQAKKAAPVAKTAEPKPLPSDVRLAVRFLISDTLTDHEIRVGLNSAWRLRQGHRFPPAAVAAAARVWFEDYNRETYRRGTRNTNVLRALNAVRDVM
ncbi:hypothetical protein [Amycolatopsis sp. cmx-4-61]|uniref:hypothetical protein n=1 Tax=Amycolatopsis sp. cmx-4-61 TaxID=2790937 RepID=UPI003978E781